jgi:glyoxylase-like metal-dependent hydrolase (beta-lactamase superfamily II)
MTEPLEIAEQVEALAHGLWHWRIRNSHIGGAISSSHALATDGGGVFVDPVRVADERLAELPAPSAIVLTARCHQRSAWRYRADAGAEVWLPEDASAADDEPDVRYAEGDRLPGGLRAIRTPGPEWPHYCFLLEREPGVLFCSDLVSNDGRGGPLRFVPPEYHDDPTETRRSVERLLELRFDILCLAHGSPVLHDPKAELERLLARRS